MALPFIGPPEEDVTGPDQRALPPVSPLPPAFQYALGQLQPPEMEPTSINPIEAVATSALGVLASVLSNDPQIATRAAESLVRPSREAQARNVSRKEAYEQRRAGITEAGAQAAAAQERAETTVEAAAARTAIAEEGRMARAEMTQQWHQETNAIRENLGLLADEVARGRLSVAQADSATRKLMAIYRTQLLQTQEKLASARAEALQDPDIKEIRQFAGPIIADAVAVILNTPEGEEPVFNAALATQDIQLEGADEIKATLLAYVRTAGVPEQRIAEWEQQLDEAIASREPAE